MLQGCDLTKDSSNDEHKDKEGEGEIFHLVPTAWLIQWVHGERTNIKKKKDEAKKGHDIDENGNVIVSAIDLTDGGCGTEGHDGDDEINPTQRSAVHDDTTLIQGEILSPENNVPDLKECSAHPSTTLTNSSRNKKPRRKSDSSIDIADDLIEIEVVKEIEIEGGSRGVQTKECIATVPGKEVIRCVTDVNNGMQGVRQQDEGDSSLGSLTSTADDLSHKRTHTH